MDQAQLPIHLAGSAPVVDRTPPEPPRIAAPTPARVRPKPRPERTVETPSPAVTPPAARATEKPAASPAQRAAGTGQGASAGTAKPAPSNAPSAARVAQLMGKWGGTIRNRVERRKRYPNGTSAAGQVRLRLTVSTSGALAGVVVTRSSGHAALDKAAVRAVQAARLPKAPKGIAPGRHSFNLTIAFSR